ncbi:hypothetical protein [Actinophytocola oryzae]|uniref:Mce-associated membrane protein n=1 Tax=Actinophytocola oryzae TaxID=502181 RepID=A0A4R7V9F6_9PSEU|nr:hypothetical protein [Actinophytocola oryzae]TDV45566.1 Mce-associated membrane protein [Actinophytocola oryzae]
MPPHRRRPAPSQGQAPPIRRPKVAGMRNRPSDVDEFSEDRVTGVLSGLRGTPPSRPEDDAETTVLPRITDDEPRAEDDREIDPETNEPPAVVDEPELAPSPEPRRKTAQVAKVAVRPAGKRRSTGSVRPDDLSAAETDTEPRRPRPPQRPTRTPAQTQISVAIILVVVAVVLAGLAVFFRGKADALASDDSNTALTDSATTSQVKGQLTNAIKQTFSYNYTDLGSTEKAVKENLTGKALCEYNLLFGEVKQYAPQQKIVLDTTVRELAVVRIDGDRAEALVYIDQLSTRVDVNKTVAVGGQFAVQAKRDGGHWKITEFDMFGQPLFNGKPAPTC